MTGALDGRVILVTGSSRGMGAAIASRAAVDGARVAVHYRTSLIYTTPSPRYTRQSRLAAAA
jgi:citronellol/citronellal dehydrogenase